MRLWSLHPRLLDRQGLTACWREGLLAQAVLLGRTRGYTAHPQLARFRAQPDPVAAVGAYLAAVRDDAARRSYRFDGARIARPADAVAMTVTDGQLAFERRHLLNKLAVRSPEDHARVLDAGAPLPHPLFTVVPGGIEPWERPG